MKVISGGAIGGARYPYGVNSYQSLSNHLNNLAASKPRSPDTGMAQLRHSQEYENKVEKQTERLYKRKERLLSLTNHWINIDKQLKHKNEYEKILNELKSTTLKGLTHEQMNAVEKHWQELFDRR